MHGIAKRKAVRPRPGYLAAPAASWGTVGTAPHQRTGPANMYMDTTKYKVGGQHKLLHRISDRDPVYPPLPMYINPPSDRC